MALVVALVPASVRAEEFTIDQEVQDQEVQAPVQPAEDVQPAEEVEAPVVPAQEEAVAEEQPDFSQEPELSQEEADAFLAELEAQENENFAQ